MSYKKMVSSVRGTYVYGHFQFDKSNQIKSDDMHDRENISAAWQESNSSVGATHAHAACTWRTFTCSIHVAIVLIN